MLLLKPLASALMSETVLFTQFVGVCLYVTGLC